MILQVQILTENYINDEIMLQLKLHQLLQIEQNIRITGHDIHSMMLHSDIEVVCMTIGRMLVQIMIHITIIYGDDEMIIQMDGDE